MGRKLLMNNSLVNDDYNKEEIIDILNKAKTVGETGWTCLTFEEPVKEVRVKRKSTISIFKFSTGWKDNETVIKEADKLYISKNPYTDNRIWVYAPDLGITWGNGKKTLIEKIRSDEIFFNIIF